MPKHLTDAQIFQVDVPGIATKRPADLAAITADFSQTEEGKWLLDNNVWHDLAMSGLDFIGEVYLVIYDKNAAMRFKTTFC